MSDIEVFQRRHSKITIYKGEYVLKKYYDNRRFKREIRAYDRIKNASLITKNVRFAKIIKIDPSNNELVIEFVPGVELAVMFKDKSIGEKILYSIINDIIEFAKESDTEGINYDCDPTNIIVSTDKMNDYKIVFIDPECINVDIQNFNIGVFMVGLIKNIYKDKISFRSIRIYKHAKLKLFNDSLSSQSEIFKSISLYSKECARSNLISKERDKLLRRVFRISILFPLWSLITLYYHCKFIFSK